MNGRSLPPTIKLTTYSNFDEERAPYSPKLPIWIWIFPAFLVGVADVLHTTLAETKQENNMSEKVKKKVGDPFDQCKWWWNIWYLVCWFGTQISLVLWWYQYYWEYQCEWNFVSHLARTVDLCIIIKHLVSGPHPLPTNWTCSFSFFASYALGKLT